MDIGKLNYIRAMKQLNSTIPHVKSLDEGLQEGLEIIMENNIRAKKFSRMWFDDEAPASIQKAFKTRTPIPDLYSDPDFLHMVSDVYQSGTAV